MIVEEYINLAAKTAHEVNRAYCQTIGDHSQPSWADTPENIKESARDGVRYVVANPECSPADLHQNWLNFKIKDRWTYGEVKDVERKTHPCMVPYYKLPEQQQHKDKLFHAVVRSIMGLDNA